MLPDRASPDMISRSWSDDSLETLGVFPVGLSSKRYADEIFERSVVKGNGVSAFAAER